MNITVIVREYRQQVHCTLGSPNIPLPPRPCPSAAAGRLMLMSGNVELALGEGTAATGSFCTSSLGVCPVFDRFIVRRSAE